MQGLGRAFSPSSGFRVQWRKVGEYRFLGVFRSQFLLPNMFILRKKVTFKLKGHNCLREAPSPFPLRWVTWDQHQKATIPCYLNPLQASGSRYRPCPRMPSSWLLQAEPASDPTQCFDLPSQSTFPGALGQGEQDGGGGAARRGEG